MIDPNTVVWQSVVAWATERRDAKLKELAKTDLSHDQSQVIRGRIAELSALIKLPETLANDASARQQMRR